MTQHTTGTREEWLAARRDLLAAEKEHTRRGDELARQRQELPWVRIEKGYRFDTDDGEASLADLFGGRSPRFRRTSGAWAGRSSGLPRTTATSTSTSTCRSRRSSSAAGASSTTSRRATSR